MPDPEQAYANLALGLRQPMLSASSRVAIAAWPCAAAQRPTPKTALLRLASCAPAAIGPPPIHVHHKFIVIDGETNMPTIYSGSPNFSAAWERQRRDVLEIKGNVRLAQV